MCVTGRHPRHCRGKEAGKNARIKAGIWSHWTRTKSSCTWGKPSGMKTVRQFLWLWTLIVQVGFRMFLKVRTTRPGRFQINQFFNRKWQLAHANRSHLFQGYTCITPRSSANLVQIVCVLAFQLWDHARRRFNTQLEANCIYIHACMYIHTYIKYIHHIHEYCGSTDVNVVFTYKYS